MPPGDNSGSQQQCFTDSATCSSFDPDVTVSAYSEGDTTGCTFEAIIDWGDGTVTDQDYDGGPDGSIDATFTNTYDDDGSYEIDWQLNDTDGTGQCGSNSGTLEFTLLSPPTDDEQGGADDESENPVNCSTPMPVNCATGVFYHTFTDFSIPGRGVPLDLTRTYESSAAATNGPFGYGWSDSYDMSLATDASGDATITQEDGSAVTFTANGSGGFTAPPRVLATLVQNADGSYTFTRDHGQTSYGFSAAGKLTSETDLNGYVTKLAYNAAGELATVTDPGGRTLTFAYTGAHVTTVTDPLGRVYTYAYDAAGDLTSAKDPHDRTWSFTYNAGHLLLTMTDPRGGKTANTYNASDQVTAQVDPDGGTTTWAYTGNPDTLDGGGTTMTDPDGDVTQYEYSYLEMVSATQGAGTAAAATTTYTYDPSTLAIISETNPDGDTTTNTVDANGNLLTTTDALGNTTTYTYNSLNEALTETDPLGDTTSYSYDADGNLLSVTDPDGDTTTYGYADADPGDITSVTNPDGDVTDYTYDRYGNQASAKVFRSATSADTIEYAYDRDSERTCVDGPNSVAAGIKCPTPGAAAVAGTTNTVYNVDGEMSSVTDPDGNVTSYLYDGDGNLSTETNPAGQVTSYGYNFDNKQTKATQPNGAVETTSYDADDNVTKQVNAAGKATTYAYDAVGQVTSTTDPLGHAAKYGYDAAGNRTTVTDPEGQVTTDAYDADSRVTGIAYSDGKTPAVSYAYDADGHRTSMSDGTGTTTYAYDADGRVTGDTDGAGATVSYGYDPAGLLTSIGYPNGEAISRTYDEAGELQSVTDWLGATTKFGYDHDGNLTSETYPNGIAAKSGYDAADALLSITDAKGSTTLASFTYTRNSLRDITADTETGSVAGTQDYSYTELSQLASDSAGSFGYDTAGDLTAQPGGETQAFNADGQLTSTTDPATTYTFNNDGDLTKDGTTALGYNQANDLTSDGATRSYAYNGDGLRMSKDIAGTVTAFAWDQSGSTPLLIQAGPDYYIDGPDGQPIEQIKGTTPTYLLTDQSGSVRLLTGAAGTVTGTYTYTPYGAVAAHTGTATVALGYDGQYTDAESGFIYLQARYYDPANGQFLTLDPLVSVTGQPYAFALGNPINLADPSGLGAIGQCYTLTCGFKIGVGPNAGGEVCQWAGNGWSATTFQANAGVGYGLETPVPIGGWTAAYDPNANSPQDLEGGSTQVSGTGNFGSGAQGTFSYNGTGYSGEAGGTYGPPGFSASVNGAETWVTSSSTGYTSPLVPTSISNAYDNSWEDSGPGPGEISIYGGSVMGHDVYFYSDPSNPFE